MGLCEHLGKCAMACAFFFVCVFLDFFIFFWYQTPQNNLVYDHFGQNRVALFCKADPTQKQTVDLHETEKSCLGMRLGGMRCLVA